MILSTSMLIAFTKIVRIIYQLFLCVPFMLLIMQLSYAGNNNITIQDEAVFEYRNLLKQHGKHQPDLLKKVLYMQRQHEDVLVRRNVAEVIGELDDPGILDILWNIILNERDNSVRNAAVAGMLNSEDKSAGRFFVKLLEDEDVFVRRQAAVGCGDIGDESRLGAMQRAFSLEGDELNKLTIASVMVRLGDEKKAKFVKDSLLNNEKSEIRKYAAQMLHDYEIVLDNEILENVMNHENDPYVKVWIACILAKRKDSSGLSYLKNTLSNSKTALLKSEAAYALSEVEQYEYVFPFLIKLLKAKDPRIRERAIEDLDDFKEFPLVHVLGKVLLNDENIIVREIAAWALGERKDKSALPFLERGLYDDSAFVRTGAVAAIYKILTAKTKRKAIIEKR